MIALLETLAQQRDFRRPQWGDKAAGLVEFLADINEHKFECVKPSGYVADTGEIDEGELHSAFEGLVKTITTMVDGRKVGALYCRSSGYGEKSGTNESIPVLYDAAQHETSWANFRAAFMQVRHNTLNDDDSVKPVLMQVLQGEIQYTDLAWRTIGEFLWPQWPDFNDASREEWDAVIAPIREEIIRCLEKERLSTVQMYVGIVGQDGTPIGTVDCHVGESLDDAIVDVYLSLYHEDHRGKTTVFLDEHGSVATIRGVVAQPGSTVHIAYLDLPINPMIGVSNEALVVRSHDYVEPDRASIRTAKGLTSYLVKGLPSPEQNKVKGMMVYYFDPTTGAPLEQLNLGMDFTKASQSHYYQTHREAFSLKDGMIVALSDLEGSFSPQIADYHLSSELLRIARFYTGKRGVPVELEGAIVNGKIHLWQITDSPLPEEVISQLSTIPPQRIVYFNNKGRGAINFRGDIIVIDGTHEGLVAQYTAQKMPFLAVGFNQRVTGYDPFVYFATVKSVYEGAGRALVFLETHLTGYACQVTFEAAHHGKQGGVYYVQSHDEFLRRIAPFIEQRAGGNVIQNVCVEAHRTGMQIYTVA